MKLTIETRDILLKENFELWKKAHETKDKKLSLEVHRNTKAYHGQPCGGCTLKPVMNKLKSYYIMMGMYV
jgi:hypothetical protein